MCGWCCGGTPAERRGEAHKSCASECYNALSPRQMRTYVQRAEKAEAALARVAEFLDAADEQPVWLRPEDVRKVLEEDGSTAAPADRAGRA
jgi:hypothetical protein